MKRGPHTRRRPGGQRAGWTSIRLTRGQMARSLRQRHALHWHGWGIGSVVMLGMLLMAMVLHAVGVQALALRYALTLGAGYLLYLLVLRWWAGRIVGERGDGLDDVPDADSWADLHGHAPSAGPSGGGGQFSGAGASGDWDAGGDVADAVGEVAGGALEVAASADEGAWVVVPVVAVFVIAALVLAGAGALAWLYFGSEVLLAVAVELAFSVAAARSAVGVERAGWMAAAVRLTWKPLLGALMAAVLLGAAIDHWLPQAQSLPQAVRLLKAR